jgi:exodeoxyribonuclease VII large subunit
LDQRARRSLTHRLKLARNRADALAARLDSLSPLAVLGRGYSLTRRLADGQLVRDATELNVGETIITCFDRGEAVSRVEEILSRERAD